MSSRIVRSSLINLSMAVTLVLTGGAFAQSGGEAGDCFPRCDTVVTSESEQAQVASQPVETAKTNACSGIAGAGKAINDAQQVYDKNVKPLKEIYGYVRSPQGLAMKLVNDHIVQIPEWVNLAADPEGYLRGKVIDYARKEAKKVVTKAVGLDKPCEQNIDSETAESLSTAVTVEAL
jgi:hypothetical protein